MNKYSIPLMLLCGSAVAEPSTTILIGGGMKTCSSLASKHCDLSQVDRLARSNSKQQNLYEIAANKVEVIVNADWLEPKQRQGAAKLRSLIGRTSLSKGDLKQLLTGSIDGEKWYQSLTDRQWFLLLDTLEQPQSDRYGQRLQEQVWLDANKGYHTPAIIDAMLNRAAQLSDGEPKILFMTSSARDPFEAVDFYQASLGEHSQWLPLDASLQAARRTGQCHQIDKFRLEVQGNLNRSSIYPKLSAAQQNHCLQPELSLKMINQAQLLFINGGDQSLTWQALRNPDGSATPELAAILTRWQQGELILAGTSAGSAVQSSQHSRMISNGSNRRALAEGFRDQAPPQRDCAGEKRCGGLYADSATYQSMGGIGGFPFGIVDTHFSERGRQLRLSQLAQGIDENQWVIGVDENSAAVVAGNHVSVVGENGVWLAQLSGKQRLLTHYLQQGDKANLGSGEVTLAKPQYDNRSSDDTPPLAKMTSENDDYRQLAQSLCASTANQSLGHVAIDGRHFGVLLNTSTHSQFSQLPSHNWCSYRAVELQYGEIKSD